MAEREVHHPEYGRGVVKQTRHKGFELLVAFENGLTRWVRSDELAESEITLQTPHLTVPLPVPSDKHFRARRMIEAFRLGIVPYDCAEEFTFGRDEETRKIMDWLNSPDEATLLIVGEYGVGKTHLLHYAISNALQNGFAVAWVEMDPNEAPFYRPKLVYSRLIQNFRYRPKPDAPLRGFREFLNEALAKGAFKEHIYFSHLIGKTHDEILWDWIEAREAVVRPWSFNNWSYSSLPGLYDYSNAANIYCYLLSGLGWAAKEILGLRGLLLVFDEAETVNMCYYSRQAERSMNYLKALIRTANNERELVERPEKSGLDYCRVGVAPYVPFLYKSPSGLKLLFAFTSLDWNYEYMWSKVPKIEEMESIPRIDLEPLPDDALKEVFKHICRLYDSSYNFLVEEDLTIDKLFRKVNTRSGRTRLFVKGSVEALDLVRLNPGKNLDEVLQ